MIAKHGTRNSRSEPEPGDAYEDLINPRASSIILVVSSDRTAFGDSAIVGIDLLSARWDVVAKRAVSFADWQRISVGGKP